MIMPIIRHSLTGDGPGLRRLPVVPVAGHRPAPTTTTPFTSNGIVNYTPAGSRKVLNKPVVLCQALVIGQQTAWYPPSGSIIPATTLPITTLPLL